MDCSASKIHYVYSLALWQLVLAANFLAGEALIPDKY
jgi:hypothetical protein